MLPTVVAGDVKHSGLFSCTYNQAIQNGATKCVAVDGVILENLL